VWDRVGIAVHDGTTPGSRSTRRRGPRLALSWPIAIDCDSIKT
jgi:hypothetical protein